MFHLWKYKYSKLARKHVFLSIELLDEDKIIQYKNFIKCLDVYFLKFLDKWILPLVMTLKMLPLKLLIYMKIPNHLGETQRESEITTFITLASIFLI